MAVNTDEYIAISGHTVYVSENIEAIIKDIAVDVMLAANAAKEAALRIILPGNNNSRASEVITKAIEWIQV